MVMRQLIRKDASINWTKIQRGVNKGKMQKCPDAISIKIPSASDGGEGVSCGIYNEKDICTQGRELYRSILRSASYLADSFVRSYVRQHAQYRFQENRKRVSYARSKDEYKRTMNRLKKGRRIAAQLVGAVNGDLEDLKNILKQAHGRTGSRRRTLIMDLVRSDEEYKSTLPTKANLDDPNVTDVQSLQKYEPGPTLMALIKSQKQNPIHVVNTATIRGLSPKIESKTMWERPVPKARQENIRRRWWTDVLDKIMPPVPVAEFQRLGDFARGKMPLEKPPQRRASLSKVVKEYSDDDLVTQLQKVGKFPGAALSFDESTGEMIRTAAPPELVASETQIRGVVRTRSIRRIYANIWNMVSTMTQNPETKEWDVRWGGGMSPSHDGEITTASKCDLELFECVDELSTTYPGQTPEWFAEQERLKIKNKDRHERKKAQKEEAKRIELSTSSRKKVRKPQQWNDRNTARPWTSKQELGHRHEKLTEEKTESKQLSSYQISRIGVGKSHKHGNAFRHWTPNQESGQRRLHTSIQRRDDDKKCEEAEFLGSSTRNSDFFYVSKESPDRHSSVEATLENTMHLVTRLHLSDKLRTHFNKEYTKKPSIIRALGKRWSELSPLEKEQQKVWTQENNAYKRRQRETKFEKLCVKPFEDLNAKQLGRIVQDAWNKMSQSEQQLSQEAWASISPKILAQKQYSDGESGHAVLSMCRDDWVQLKANHRELKRRRKLEKLEAQRKMNKSIRQQLEVCQRLEDEVSERMNQVARLTGEMGIERN